MIEIKGREVTGSDYLSPVTYVPGHAKGNAGHSDCERGVIIEVKDNGSIAVLYSASRTVQQTNPEDLVWG